MDNEKLGTPDAAEQAKLLEEEARGINWCLRHEKELFDLVAGTREKLRPFLVTETFETGTIPTTYLAIDTILQAAFEQMLASHDQKVREPLAAWMIANSFATGHGDTVEDLLKELKWQIKERDQKVHRP